ncbi:MAG: hypothetical protein E7660_01175 [Ruminococcaceae bacterium]|nr:hypothetical protein [Oscillospiraceae bacterium]
MKKALSLFLAIMMVLPMALSAVPVSAAGDPYVVALSGVGEDVIEHGNGYWENTDGVEWYYYYSPTVYYTLTMSDGSTLSGYSWELSNNYGYRIDSWGLEQSAEAPLGLGPQTGNADCRGPAGEYVTGQYSFNIVESPVESISAAVNAPIIEHTGGYWNTEADGTEWFYYQEPNDLTITVNMKDGSTYTGQSSEIYNAIGYMPQREMPEQSAEAPLGIGHHTGKVTLLDKECTFAFEIAESPVASFWVETPSPVIEHSNGNWQDGANGQWYCYYSPALVFHVEMKDGTIVSGYPYQINEAVGVWPQYWLPSQDENNQLGIGVHQGTASIMGIEVSFDFEIIENPVASFSAYPAKDIVEHTGGNWENTDGTEWYRYYIPEIIYVVTTKDGAVYEGNGSYIYEIFGQSPSYEGWRQTVDDQAGIGEHPMKVYFGGFEAVCNIKIVPSPYKSISAVYNGEIEEFTNGYYNYENGEKWFMYYLPDSYNIIYTVELTDGTVFEGKDWQIANEFGSYPTISMPSQTYETALTPGTHKGSVTFKGVKGNFTFTIRETPFASFEIISVNTVLSSDETVWTDGDYYYCPDFVYKVTMKDGSSYIDRYNATRSWESDIYFSHDQVNNPWTEGGENGFTAYFKHLSASANAKFKTDDSVPEEPERSDEYEYFVQDGGAVITYYNYWTKGGFVVPDEIDGYPVIGVEYLFDDWNGDSITEITIPDSVKFIGEELINSSLYNLAEVHIGAGVSYLEDSYFEDCGSLFSINVSEDNETYKTIGYSVYTKDGKTLVAVPQGINGKSIVIPDGCENFEVIYNHPLVYPIYEDGSSIYNIIDGVTYSPDMKTVISCDKNFAGEYEMPESVETIAPHAFESCFDLTYVSVSGSVTEITYSAFAWCVNLAEVEIPETVEAIGDYAFASCYDLKGISVTGVETIGKRAFDCCEKLSYVELGENFRSVGDYAFAHAGLYEIEIPEGARDLGDYAFYNCAKLVSAVVPGTVENLENTFNWCPSLENVTLGEGILSLNGAFAYCEALEEITLPSSLEDLGTSSFAGCSSLRSITLPEKITVIGDSSFNSCSSLEEVTAKGIIYYIGRYAFSGTGMKEITLKDGLEVIDLGAFRNSALTSVTIPGSVTNIVYGAFQNATDLTDIDLPDTALEIGAHAFDNTAWFESQPEGATYADNHFYKYKGDIIENTTVTVKDGTLTIANYAFENAEYRDEYLEEWGYRYYFTDGLTKVVLPEGLRRIGTMAFVNCYGLKDINLPEGLEVIGESAFANCYSLEKLHIPSTLKEIGQGAFVGCTSIKEITVDEDNPYFTVVDGILYSKDLSTLIYCPPARTAPVTIPKETKLVLDCAFDNIEGLEITVKGADTEFDAFAAGYFMDYNMDSDGSLSYYYFNVSIYPHFICYENSEAKAHADNMGIAYIIVEEEIEVKNETTGITVTGTTSDNITEEIILVAEQVEVLPEEKEVMFDIYLTLDGEVVQPEGEVTVAIPVPQGLDGDKCRVYYQDENGKRIDMKAKFIDGKMVFDVDHFSNYVVAEIDYVIGDADGDGKINTKDVLMLRKYLGGAVSTDKINLTSADADLDGKVTMKDVLMLRKYLGGVIDEL